MSIEIEDIMMELVKNVGESNKALLARVAIIEENIRNGATHDDMVELVKAIYKVHEDTQNIICFVSDGENKIGAIDVITKWDKLWSAISGIKTVAAIIIGIVLSIGGFIWFLFKLIEWYPSIQHLIH